MKVNIINEEPPEEIKPFVEDELDLLDVDYEKGESNIIVYTKKTFTIDSDKLEKACFILIEGQRDISRRSIWCVTNNQFMLYGMCWDEVEGGTYVQARKRSRQAHIAGVIRDTAKDVTKQLFPEFYKSAAYINSE